MTRTKSPEPPLLERDGELVLIASAFERAAGGNGGTLVVEGPAGIGKTRLLDAARSVAPGHGFRVLTARASPLERDFGFGVVRALLEPATRPGSGLPVPDDGAAHLAAAVLDPDATGATPTFAALHGIYWLVVALAEQAPLLLAVDDGHWVDGPSLRTLHHLARRIDHLPVLLALTTRPNEPGADAEVLDALRDDPATTVLRPAPLSARGAAAMLRRVLGDEVAPEFAAACHEVAEGNPLLLRALVGSLHQAGVAPTAAGVAAVRERAPGIVSAFVLPRLRHLPREASAVARALAVLGPGAAVRHLAAVSGLGSAVVAGALDQLAGADLVTTGPAFAHPLLGQAVLDRVPAGERLAGHQRAARELAADGAAAEAVAAHLLQLEPLRDPWVVGRLRDAAAAAMAAGAPQTAVTYLERALGEPPTGEDRIDVLAELGEALCQAGPTAGFDRLAEALALAVDPARRDRIALQLARRLEMAWEMPRALGVLAGAAAEIDERGPGDQDAALLVEAELIGLARTVPSLRLSVRARLDRLGPAAGPDTAAGCFLLVDRAVDVVQEPGRTAEAVDLARRALAGAAGLPGGPSEISLLYLAAPVLVTAGELAAAATATEGVAERARRRGARTEFAAALAMRSDITCRRGALLDAEADLRMSQDLLDEVAMPYPARLVAGLLVPGLVWRGLLADAEHELDVLGVGHNQAGVLWAVGRLRLAQDRPAEALDALRECGARLEKRAWAHPGLLSWRTDAALACHRLGRLDRARELADAALVDAQRYAAAIPLGQALRVVGLVGADLDALRAAVDVLAAAPARLEHALALVELGAALRRANQRTAAREPLRAGLELAHRCAATALSARATEELAAAGARPRTPLRTGIEALSPSERRVAALAAAGRSNREIAQALFVTTKTVEVHLSASYRKLRVAGRTELAGLFD